MHQISDGRKEQSHRKRFQSSAQVRFAADYADQTERDYQARLKAIKQGRIKPKKPDYLPPLSCSRRSDEFDRRN